MAEKTLTIDLADLNIWANQFPEALRAGGEIGVEESITLLENAVKTNVREGDSEIRGRVATGILLGAVFSEMRGTPAQIRGVIAVSPPADRYALVVEEGRTPGSRMPPSEALIPWVIQKLGDTIKITSSIRAQRRGRKVPIRADRQAAARSLAFVIARSIGRKGFAGIHMFGRAFEKLGGAVEQIIGERISEAIKGMSR